MLIDLTLEITPALRKSAEENEPMALIGHMGTHFDVMDKVFPLDYTITKGVVFSVDHVKGRDITLEDVNIEKIQEKMFVAFYSGFIEEEDYGTEKYFKEHPQLSVELIDALLEKNVAIIGVDFAGIRRGKEHTPMDQYCADRNVFVIENLCNLGKIKSDFTAYTFPVKFTGVTGLPCRVVAQV